MPIRVILSLCAAETSTIYVFFIFQSPLDISEYKFVGKVAGTVIIFFWHMPHFAYPFIC